MEADKILVGRYNELIKHHQAIVAENNAMIAFYKNSLASLLKPPVITKDKQEAKPIPTKQTGNGKPKRRSTSGRKGSTAVPANKLLEESTVKLLTEKQDLLNASVLRENYNKASGKTFSVDSFSPRISQLTKKGIIVKYVIEGNKISTKFVYGLPEWFENGILKPEYVEKTKAGQTQLL